MGLSENSGYLILGSLYLIRILLLGYYIRVPLFSETPVSQLA